MTQLTFQTDKNIEQAIEELKVFFGTNSAAAVVRSAIAIARTVVPTSKDRTIIIRDQNKNEDLKIVFT